MLLTQQRFDHVQDYNTQRCLIAVFGEELVIPLPGLDIDSQVQISVLEALT